jgi:hypothetical protein
MNHIFDIPEEFKELKTFNYVFIPANENLIYKPYALGHPYPHSEESKLLMSLAKKGIKKSPEHIEKVRQARLGAKQTDYQKQRARETLEAAWVVTTPKGVSMNIVNLRNFCKQNGLDQGNMVKVSQGILKQHKGWTCYKVA